MEPENSSLKSSELDITSLLSLVSEEKSWEDILENCEISTLTVLDEKMKFLIPRNSEIKSGDMWPVYQLHYGT